jgi:hypothetical protein
MVSTQQSPDVHVVETTGVLATVVATAEADFVTGDTGQYIFQALVISIGTVGTLANGMVLMLLVTSSQLKKQSVNILFINQMSLDLFGCVWLLITYSLKISNLYLTGPSGYWLCVFVVSENFIWYGLVGSIVNLVNIAVERYTMIVHPMWHKKHFRSWMTYVAVALAWISGILESQIVSLTTTVIVYGQCFQLAVWSNDGLKVFYGVWSLACYYVIILVILLYCYCRILLSVRQQSRVFVSQHDNNILTKANRERNLRIQTNIIKTTILVSVSFAVCWMPCQMYALLQMVETNANYSSEIYYVTMFVAFFYACLNPFIYAANYDVIKQRWRRLAERNNQTCVTVADQVLVMTVQPSR